MKIPFALALTILLAGCGDPAASPEREPPIPAGTPHIFTVGGDGEAYAITADGGVAHVGVNGVTVLPVPNGVFEIHRAGAGAIALVGDSIWRLDGGRAFRLPVQGYLMDVVETPEHTFLRVFHVQDNTQLYRLDGSTLVRIDR